MKRRRKAEHLEPASPTQPRYVPFIQIDTLSTYTGVPSEPQYIPIFPSEQS